MPQGRAAVQSIIDRLQQERDQLRVQLHLAGMEARDEYERISGRVDDLKAHYEPLRESVGDTAENVFAALGIAADELWRGFGRVRKAITDKES